MYLICYGEARLQRIGGYALVATILVFSIHEPKGGSIAFDPPRAVSSAS